VAPVTPARSAAVYQTIKLTVNTEQRAHLWNKPLQHGTCLLQEDDKKLYSASPSDSGDECRDDLSDVKVEIKDYDQQDTRLGCIECSQL